MSYDLVLIAPWSSTENKLRPFGAPPLELHGIANYVRNEGFSALVIDPSIEIDLETRIREALPEGNSTLVAVNTKYSSLPNNLGLLHLINQIDPNATLVAYGEDASLDPPLIFENSPAKIVVAGQGEKPTLNLLKKKKHIKDLIQYPKENENFPGLILKAETGQSLTFPILPFTQEEYESSMLNFDFSKVPYEKYWEMTKGFYAQDLTDPRKKEVRSQEIYTARIIESYNCVRQCTFCPHSSFLGTAAPGQRIPHAGLSAEAFVEVVKNMAEAHAQLRRVHILSNDYLLGKDADYFKAFNANLDAARKEDLVYNGIDFVFHTVPNGRISNFLPLLKYFSVIGFGAESFSQRVLDEINKGTKVDRIKGDIQAVLDAGKNPFINIQLATPNSTIFDMYTTINETLNYAEKGAQVAVYPHLLPVPGSKIYNNPELQALISFEERRIPYSGKSISLAMKVRPQDQELRNLMDRYGSEFIGFRDEKMRQHNITHLSTRMMSLIIFEYFYGLAKELKLPVPRPNPEHQIQRIQSLYAQY